MQNIINGKHVDASDGSVINIVNPFTGRKIDTVPNATAKDVINLMEYTKEQVYNKFGKVIEPEIEIIK